LDQCKTNENTQLAITTKGFSAVRSVRLILAIYLIFKYLLLNIMFSDIVIVKKDKELTLLL